MRKNVKQPCRHQGERKRGGGEEVLQVPEQRLPSIPWIGWSTRLSPCSPWRITLEHISAKQSVEDTTPQQVDMPRWKLQPMESSWQELQWAEKSPHRDRFSGRTCGLWGTHTGAVSSWRAVPGGEEKCWTSLWRTVACGKNPRWNWEKVWERRRSNYGLITTPIPLFCLGGGWR